MKRPNARKGRSETSGRRPFENSEKLGRPAPRLVLVAGLEELPRATIEAETHEDELRLRGWLAQPAVRRRLLDVLDDLLSELREAA